MVEQQPWLHDAVCALHAPTQAWSAVSGVMGGGIHGIYHADTRVVAGYRLLLGGDVPQPLAQTASAAGRLRFVAAVRVLPAGVPDGATEPRVLVTTERTVTADRVTEHVTIASALSEPLSTMLELRLVPDFAPLAGVRAGTPVPPPLRHRWLAGRAGIELAHAGLVATVTADGGQVRWRDGVLTLRWPLTVPPHAEQGVAWAVRMRDAHAVVAAAPGTPEWADAAVAAHDPRLGRWLARSLSDLTALRMTTVARPGEVFLAAGAPWYFTLFGRDSLVAARMLLPFGTELAASTLRVLAGLQGTVTDPVSEEQPGKIAHELRPAAFSVPAEGLRLPPLYYGTIDATPLWICLLVDAWRWGLADAEVHALMPALLRALGWLEAQGAKTGFLAYQDLSGHGLANQGWKDSAEAVQGQDGSLPRGPIALCEVQGYAFEAASGAAELLDHLGVPGGAAWRAWAQALATRFRARFWVGAGDAAYPAIALDADQRPVDAVASNMGHLLGTGLLNACEEELVAARLVGPALNAGVGLRTLAADAAGYWPLSYHAGAVWTHDTAVAITGLARAGFQAEAATLSRGLLIAAEAFDYRSPELHSGAPGHPVPYPAACRPQAWSAAAAVAVVAAALELVPHRDHGTVGAAATSWLGPLTLTGIRVGGVRQPPLRSY